MKTTERLDLKHIHKIIDDALKPMSIIAIKEKFNLSFPFKVKRVKDSHGKGGWPGITVITEIKKDDDGRYSTNNETERIVGNTRYINGQCAEVMDYILHEEN